MGGNDQKNVKVFEKLDLKNGEHTIKLTSVARAGAGQSKSNVDWFEIIAPSDAANKVELQAQIEAGAGLLEGAYTTESWDVYSKALDAAVKVMNDANATSETAAERATSLKEAREQLVLIDDASIEFDTEAHLAFPAIESRAVCTSWDAVKDAATYRVRVFAADAEGAPTGDALSDIVVDGVLARVSGLDPERPTSCASMHVTRRAALSSVSRARSTPCPSHPRMPLKPPRAWRCSRARRRGEAVLSWNAVEGATRYHVYVNGVKSATVDTASVMLSGLVKDGVYSVKLVASSDSGATSLPASLVFTYEGAQEPAVDYAGKIRDLLDANKNLVESEYEAAAWKQFAEARDAAQKLLDDDSADESALKAAYEKLVDALENLADHPAKPEPGVDYAEMIRKVLEESKGLAEDEYEPEAWTRFAAARNAAQALLDAGSDDAER